MDCKTRNKATEIEINGKSANSVSPTDTWFKTYYDKTGKVICRSFIKIWVSGIFNQRTSSDSILALDYEARVYQQIKELIIDTGKSQDFVEIIDFKEGLTFDETIDILFQGVLNNPTAIKEFSPIVQKLRYKSTASYVNSEPIIDNVADNEVAKELLKHTLYRNIQYMICGIRNRPSIYSINNNVNEDARNQDMEDDGMRRKCVENLNTLEPLQKYVRFNMIETKTSPTLITFNEFITNNTGNNALIMNVFINILESVDILNNQHIYHHDLHLGNIFVDPANDNHIYIYDFDRAFSSSQGYNKLLGSYLCNIVGQCNEENPVTDFFKLICEMYSKNIFNDLQAKFIMFQPYPSTPAVDIFFDIFNREKGRCWLPRNANIPPIGVFFNDRTTMINQVKRLRKTL